MFNLKNLATIISLILVLSYSFCSSPMTREERAEERISITDETNPQNIQMWNTRLKEAVENRDTEAILEALRNNADVNYSFDYTFPIDERNMTVSITPLALATYLGYLDIVELLISNGADINRTINLTFRFGLYREYNMLELAVLSGNMELINYFQSQVLQLEYSSRAVEDAIKYQYFEIARYLVESGAEVCLEHLQQVIAYDNLDMTIFLLENGVEINGWTDSCWCSPLNIAAQRNNYDIAQLLVEHGADVNIRDCQCRNITPISNAVANNNYEITRLLVENGADVNRDLLTFEQAIINDNIRIVGLLIDHCTEIPSFILPLAAENGLKNMVQFLIYERRMDIDSRDSLGDTALIKACDHCNYEIVVYLVEHGADVSIRGFMNKTALNHANDCFNSQISDYLWERGARLGTD